MKIATVVLLLFAQGVFSQDFDAGNFERQKGVAKIAQMRTCVSCKVKDKHHIKTFIFDESGFNIEKYNVDHGKNSGVTKYIWNSDGTINNVQVFHSFAVTQKAANTKTTAAESAILKWDSTKMTGEGRYDYAGSRLNSISWTDAGRNTIIDVIGVYYDNNGKIARVERSAIPSAGVISGMMEGSANTVASLPAESPIKYSSTFRYAADSVFIEYFKSGVRSGSGKRRLNKAGKVIYEIIYNSTGKMIYECKSKYNQNGKIIEQSVVQTGVDGFGDVADATDFDKITYRYDARGRLAIAVKSKKTVDVVTDTFEYR